MLKCGWNPALVKRQGRELLAQVDQKRGLWHYGPELQESAQAKAQRLIGNELQAKGWTEQDVLSLPKSGPFKVQLALNLHAETTMTLAWIAQWLHMGTRDHLAQLLCSHTKINAGVRAGAPVPN